MNPLVYFDYCATTPVHPNVLQVMLPLLKQTFGNPSSMHWAGRAAAELKENSRAIAATSLGCKPDEIFFTSGATEADNLAILGVLREFEPQKAHLITCLTEHHAVLHAAQHAEKEGYAVTYLPVGFDGIIDLDRLVKSIRPETRLISIMLVNNETGVIQPVREISQIAREHQILTHTDAVQAMLIPDNQVDQLGVNLLSISAHKIYGPKGIGALFIREGTPIHPIIFGGPQEMGLRAGTENMPGIVGLAAALQHISQTKAATRNRLSELRQRLSKGLRTIFPKVIINGNENKSSPHVISASFPGASAEMLLLRLTMQGLAVSLGSACTSREIVPSHVLKAMGLPLDYIEGTLRISLGEPSIEEEVDQLLGAIQAIIQDVV